MPFERGRCEKSLRPFSDAQVAGFGIAKLFNPAIRPKVGSRYFIHGARYSPISAPTPEPTTRAMPCAMVALDRSPRPRQRLTRTPTPEPVIIGVRALSVAISTCHLFAKAATAISLTLDLQSPIHLISSMLLLALALVSSRSCRASMSPSQVAPLRRTSILPRPQSPIS